MRLANLSGRAALVSGDRALDVETASRGKLPAALPDLYDRWGDLEKWAGGTVPWSDATSFDRAQLGPPSPRPRQVFALGINYAPHATEAGYVVPTVPVVFTKYPSCLAGPDTSVHLSGGTVDWEVELVVVVGREAKGLSDSDAWSHVAGVTIGQDLSDRTLQSAATPPQFSLAKSFPGYGPTGPVLVTPDELSTPDDLAISCELDGEIVQDARTCEMVFSVPRILAELTAVCTLWPGDLVFTGTPGGVGHRRTPPRYLQPGDRLTSRIEGIGELHQRFTA